MESKETQKCFSIAFLKVPFPLRGGKGSLKTSFTKSSRVLSTQAERDNPAAMRIQPHVDIGCRSEHTHMAIFIPDN